MRPCPVRSRSARGVVLAAVLAVPMLLTGCGNRQEAPSAAAATPPAPSGTGVGSVQKVQGRVGALVLGDGYVPEPASPSVAAAYLTVVNHGNTDARLTAVRSDSTAMVMPMTETTEGAVGGMAALDTVTIPAHGAFRFRPGAAHLMLEQPDPVPKVGGTVAVTLTFDPGGAVTLALPVTPITGSG